MCVYLWHNKVFFQMGQIWSVCKSSRGSKMECFCICDWWNSFNRFCLGFKALTIHPILSLSSYRSDNHIQFFLKNRFVNLHFLGVWGMYVCLGVFQSCYMSTLNRSLLSMGDLYDDDLSLVKFVNVESFPFIKQNFFPLHHPRGYLQILLMSCHHLVTKQKRNNPFDSID